MLNRIDCFCTSREATKIGFLLSLESAIHSVMRKAACWPDFLLVNPNCRG